MLDGNFTSETDKLRGRLLKNESLCHYTSWRVGGPASLVFLPADIDDLIHFIKLVNPQTPLYWLGLGSNTLVRDNGINGIVIVTQRGLHGITQQSDFIFRAEAGVACGQLARQTARLGLTGLEFLAGIPGTVGGALAMNAGCYGGETWQYVTKVETINRDGEIHQREKNEFEIAYRHVLGKQNEWFIAGYFCLKAGNKAHSIETIKTLLEKRNMSQPTSWPNGGSVFRNPPGQYAAKLIEECGLKGYSIGQARISDKHANFIINEGNATAKDIETLIGYIGDVVEKQKNIRLVPEVCIIGNA